METYKLTKRQIQVALLFIEGLSYREIGEYLYLSSASVGSHMERIYRALKVNNRKELTEIFRSSEIVVKNKTRTKKISLNNKINL